MEKHIYAVLDDSELADDSMAYIYTELTMDVYLSPSKVILFGLRPSKDDDFDIEDLGLLPSQEKNLLVVIEEESQASRKIWHQDLPYEFFEKADQPGGMQEFIDSLKNNTEAMDE